MLAGLRKVYMGRRSPCKQMASNAYSLVHAVLLVCFERAQSPAVAAATTDCLKAILASMASGAPPLHSSPVDAPLLCMRHSSQRCPGAAQSPQNIRGGARAPSEHGLCSSAW